MADDLDDPVEGVWEVLRLHQLGLQAVALLGTHASRTQLPLRKKLSPWLLLDGDQAGRRATHRLAEELGVPVLRVPEGTDPAELTDRQLRRALRPLFFLNQPER